MCGWVCEVVKIFLVQHQITTRPREVAVPAVVPSTVHSSQLGSTWGVYLRAANTQGLVLYLDNKQHQCHIDLILSAWNGRVLSTALSTVPSIVLCCTSDDTENTGLQHVMDKATSAHDCESPST